MPSPAGLPDILRTDVEFSDHAEGARTIETMLGVGPELLRDGEGWAVETFTRLGTHHSTHVDAPYHYNSTIAGRPARRIDELPLEWFFAPGVVLDMTHKADGDAMTADEAEAAMDAAGHALGVLGPAGERDHVVVGRVGLRPPEAAPVEVHLPQSGFGLVRAVEV